jgi:hypothetical protein
MTDALPRPAPPVDATSSTAWGRATDRPALSKHRHAPVALAGWTIQTHTQRRRKETDAQSSP